jgi:hypothetical protein
MSKHTLLTRCARATLPITDSNEHFPSRWVDRRGGRRLAVLYLTSGLAAQADAYRCSSQT